MPLLRGEKTTTLAAGDHGTCRARTAETKADVGLEMYTFKVKRRRLDVFEDDGVPKVEWRPWVYLYKVGKTRATFNLNPWYFESGFTITKDKG